MGKTILIINEQHSLFEEQEDILNEVYGDWEIIEVPKEGWSLSEQREVADKIHNKLSSDEIGEETGNVVVFASPVPYLLKRLTLFSQATVPVMDSCKIYSQYQVQVFHNDRREKKELPNGKVIHKIASEGWQLV